MLLWEKVCWFSHSMPRCMNWSMYIVGIDCECCQMDQLLFRTGEKKHIIWFNTWTKSRVKAQFNDVHECISFSGKMHVANKVRSKNMWKECMVPFYFGFVYLYVDDHVEMQSMEVAIFRSLSFSLDAPAISFFFHYVAFKDDCTFA